MLTLKSDDVYGRSKAYESIIKGTEIIGPKVPESFNVLVKELQGLGLKVDLIEQEGDKVEVLDAEDMLSKNVADEAKHMPEVEVPQNEISNVDVTEDAAVADDFDIVETTSEGDVIHNEETTITEGEETPAEIEGEEVENA